LLIVGSVGRITAKAYPEYLSKTTNFLDSSPSYNLAIPNSSQKKYMLAHVITSNYIVIT